SDLCRLSFGCDLAPSALVVLEGILRVLGLEVGNRVEAAPDTKWAHLGQWMDLKDVIRIRVRDVVGIGLTLNVMRFAPVLRPDAPDADHLNGAAEVVLDVLEGLGEVGGVHDLGDG